MLKFLLHSFLLRFVVRLSSDNAPRTHLTRIQLNTKYYYYWCVFSTFIYSILLIFYPLLLFFGMHFYEVGERRLEKLLMECGGGGRGRLNESKVKKVWYFHMCILCFGPIIQISLKCGEEILSASQQSTFPLSLVPSPTFVSAVSFLCFSITQYLLDVSISQLSLSLFSRLFT